MAMADTGNELKIPTLVIPKDDRLDMDREPVPAVKRRQKPGRKLNGVVKGDTRSMYISPAGTSALDIRTRLRISEAELAIVQREYADLLSEKDALETSARTYEESWKFAVQECGRVVEQRDELKRKLLSLENAVSAAYHPENHKETNKKKKVTRADLEQCKVALETQTRVAETLEHERDQAYDDYQFAQAQLHTLMHQYQQLANTCSEVAREREKAKAEVVLLREELRRFEPESEVPGSSLSRSSSRKMSESEAPRLSCDNIGAGPSPNLPLEEQVKELREERENLRAAYDILLKRSEQYQRQVQRADEERRQALATSEALTVVWQKKFEKAQLERYESHQDLLSAQDRITHLTQQLAMARLQSGDGPRHSPSEGELAKKAVQNSMYPHRGSIPTPQRTASFHGSLTHDLSSPTYSHSSSSSSLTKKPYRSSGSINKVLSKDRHTLSSSSTTTSTQEQFGSLNDNAFVPDVHNWNRGMENLEYGAGTGSSQSTEDEASWI